MRGDCARDKAPEPHKAEDLVVHPIDVLLETQSVDPYLGTPKLGTSPDIARVLAIRAAAVLEIRTSSGQRDSVRNVECVTVLSPQGELNGELA